MSEEGAVAGPSRLPLSQNAENRALHDYFQGYDDFGFEVSDCCTIFQRGLRLS